MVAVNRAADLILWTPVLKDLGYDGIALSSDWQDLKRGTDLVAKGGLEICGPLAPLLPP